MLHPQNAVFFQTVHIVIADHFNLPFAAFHRAGEGKIQLGKIGRIFAVLRFVSGFGKSQRLPKSSASCAMASV